jgi:hypothetical protein
MTVHSVDDADDAKEVVQWTGLLSDLFADWRKDGTTCEEQTDKSEYEVRQELLDTGTCQIDGFVGCYHVLTVVKEA